MDALNWKGALNWKSKLQLEVFFLGENMSGKRLSKALNMLAKQ